MDFTRDALEASGFVGWLPFSAIRGSACPSTGGVYVVTYVGDEPVAFDERSCGGWFKAGIRPFRAMRFGPTGSRPRRSSISGRQTG